MASLKDIRSAKAAIRTQLLQLGLGGWITSRAASISMQAAVTAAGRNVHAVGIGRKNASGGSTSDLCVRLYVVQKLPESVLAPRDRLPRAIDGIPTDVVEAEPAFLLAKRKKAGTNGRAGTKAIASVPACSKKRKEKQRPVMAGIGAGHPDVTVGTLGCFGRSTNSEDDASAVFALSNNHVFANVNHALIGDPLYQPGPIDGGTFLDHFANLHRYVPIKMGGTQANRVDAAIGVVLGGVQTDWEICSIGTPTGTRTAEEGMLIRKHGRTTGYTEGRIDDIEYDALVGMNHNDPDIVALFEDQLRIVSATEQPIALGGDSGSAVVHRTEDSVVGLYFAGPSSGAYGVANKIEHVLSELEIAIG